MLWLIIASALPLAIVQELQVESYWGRDLVPGTVKLLYEFFHLYFHLRQIDTAHKGYP